MEHTWSKYQLDIFDFAKNGKHNGAVIACAGSSKTTVGIKSMEMIPYQYDAYFATFAKKIADELSLRLKGRDNVGASTYNAFGWRLAIQHMQLRPKMDENKSDNILKKIFDPNGDDAWKFWKSRNSIKRLVSLFKGLYCTNTDQANMAYPGLVEKHKIDVPQFEWFLPVLLDAYQRSLKMQTVFDFDDQKFMPLYLNLPFPEFDMLLIDEFQDTNLLELKLMYNALRKDGNSRVIAIGDPDQSIYSFRGASPETMQDFVKQMEAKLLPLYICYRCSKAIVREAQKIVPHIEAFPGNPEGIVDTIDKANCVKMIQDHDMVLSRTVAPAVAFCMQRIREGRDAYVEGRDIGVDILDLIAQISDDDYMSGPEFKIRMEEWVGERIDRYIAYGKESSALALRDKADTVEELLLDCDTVSDLRQKTAATFKNEGKGIQCLSIHKSKGLESKPGANVFLLRPDLLPHPRGDAAEERRIEYVADTRGKLNFFKVLKDKNEK